MKEKIRTLQTIHLAICAGLSIAYFVIGQPYEGHLKMPILDSSSIVYLIIPIAGFIASNYMFKLQLKKADRDLKPEENLPIYQTASIIRWGILELATFVLIFLRPDFFLFGIVLIVYLISLRPTEEKITNDIKSATR
jgi:hypothetical protein